MKQDNKELSTSNFELDASPVVNQKPPSVIFSRKPEQAFKEMKELVRMMASQCQGSQFISTINGKNYPRVEWWTTLGATLGLFPVVAFSRRLDREDEVVYESRVEVRKNGIVVAAGEALCSSLEPNWQDAPEYSIKSMSITRATGKAYRIPLSFIAVMAGLSPTNVEEMDGLVFQSESAPKMPKMATPNQEKYIHHLYESKYGMGYVDLLEKYLEENYQVISTKELTKEEASKVIEQFLK